MSDSEKKNLKLNGKDDFPLLKMGIEELQRKIANVLAPQGFYHEGGAVLVKGKKQFSKHDVQTIVNDVYAFCHNERVRILKEVHNLTELFGIELQETKEKIMLETNKSFLQRDMSGLRVMEENAKRLQCKIDMLVFLHKLVNV